MVQDNGDLVLVKDLGEARLLKLGDGHRGGDVVAQDDVQLCLDQLARPDLRQPGVGCRIFCVIVMLMMREPPSATRLRRLC